MAFSVRGTTIGAATTVGPLRRLALRTRNLAVCVRHQCSLVIITVMIGMNFLTVSAQPRELFGVRWDSGSHTQEPLMNMNPFSIVSFRNGNIVTVIIRLGEYGIIAVLPLCLQFTLGFVAWWTDANWRSDRFSGQASFSLDSSRHS